MKNLTSILVSIASIAVILVVAFIFSFILNVGLAIAFPFAVCVIVAIGFFAMILEDSKESKNAYVNVYQK